MFNFRQRCLALRASGPYDRQRPAKVILDSCFSRDDYLSFYSTMSHVNNSETISHHGRGNQETQDCNGRRENETGTKQNFQFLCAALSQESNNRRYICPYGGRGPSTHESPQHCKWAPGVRVTRMQKSTTFTHYYAISYITSTFTVMSAALLE